MQLLSQSDTHLEAGETFAAASGGTVSLFTQQGPLHIIAAHGPLSLHAHKYFWTIKLLGRLCDTESPLSSRAPNSDSISRGINYYDTRTFPERRKKVEVAKKILCDEY